MTQAKSGGGLNMNKVTHVNSPKAEPISHQVSMNRPSMIGASTHFVKPPLYQSTQASTPYGATPGNDCRPGGNGRVVMKAGTQSSTPAAHRMPKGRPTF
jgi:hypothetical protein